MGLLSTNDSTNEAREKLNNNEDVSVVCACDVMRMCNILQLRDIKEIALLR